MTSKQAAKLVRTLERYQADVVSSMATPDELLAAAWSLWENAKKWPTKRYRVEGSSAGNSAVVTLKTALRIAIRCGGRAKEVIPTRKEATARTRGLVVMP